MFSRAGLVTRAGIRVQSRLQIRLQSSYSKIVAINDLKEFERRTKDAKLSVIDFYATWCGPCKAMAPHLSKLVNEHPNVNFYKVDVDESSEIASHCQITAMPTFVLSKDGEFLDKIIGANPKVLEDLINKYDKSAE